MYNGVKAMIEKEKELEKVESWITKIISNISFFLSISLILI